MTPSTPVPQPIFTEEQLADKERLLDELAATIASGEAVAFVGAGSSISAGFDAWDGLLEKLAIRAEQLSPGFSRDTLPKGIDNRLTCAQLIRDHIVRTCGLQTYHDEIGRIFTCHPLRDRLTQFHFDIVRLPFRAFLTTNYDEVIEEAFREAYPGERRPAPVPIWNGDMKLVSPAIRSLSSPGLIQYVIHVHGIYSIGSTIVLCEDDYREAYGFCDARAGSSRKGNPYPPRLFTLMTALLATRRLVFIGFTLEDPYFAEVLRRVSDALWEWGESVHFVIAPIAAPTALETRTRARKFKDAFGIQTVFYEVVGDDHDERDNLVKQLLIRIKRGKAALESSSGRPLTAPAGEAVGHPLPDWAMKHNASQRARIEKRES